MWIGKPLDIVVPLTLQGGQTADALCLEADLMQGDSRIDDKRLTVSRWNPAPLPVTRAFACLQRSPSTSRRCRPAFMQGATCSRSDAMSCWPTCPLNQRWMSLTFHWAPLRWPCRRSRQLDPVDPATRPQPSLRISPSHSLPGAQDLAGAVKLRHCGAPPAARPRTGRARRGACNHRKPRWPPCASIRRETRVPCWEGEVICLGAAGPLLESCCLRARRSAAAAAAGADGDGIAAATLAPCEQSRLTGCGGRGGWRRWWAPLARQAPVPTNVRTLVSQTANPTGSRPPSRTLRRNTASMDRYRAGVTRYLTAFATCRPRPATPRSAGR